MSQCCHASNLSVTSVLQRLGRLAAMLAALSFAQCGDGDPVPEDADRDGVVGVADNCPVTKNAAQHDRDENGVGDACEARGPFAPTFEVSTYDPARCSEGITVFAVQGGEATFENPDWIDFGYLAAVPLAPNGSTETEVKPLYVYSDTSTGAFSDVSLLPNGNLLAIRGDDGGSVLEELDTVDGGSTTVSDDVMVNHAAQRLPDGGAIFIYSYFIEHDTYGVDVDDDGKRETRVEAVRIIDEAGDPVWDWDVYQHDPNAASAPAYVAFTEWWSNCNAVSFFPDDGWEAGKPLTGDVYLNCRLLNRLYKINYPSGVVEWVMGDGGDFGAGFFHHSHDPQISFDRDASGRRVATRILMYDNREAPILGAAEPCPPDETCPWDIERYSRIIEVVVDNDLNAEIVWKWPSPAQDDFDAVRFYSPIGGGVARLENGNILVTNATDGGNPFMGDRCRGSVLEIVPDAAPSGAEIVWKLRFGENYATYKAIRVAESAVDGWESYVAP